MGLSTFEQVNAEIFGNELSFMPIHIRHKLHRESTWAMYSKGHCWIFKDELLDCGIFTPHQVFAIVAHETIHHAQRHYTLRNDKDHLSYSHNGAFFRHYARKIEKAYGHKIEAAQERYEP